MSRTKQETLLLEERIEKIRKRNEELKRRHLEVEADKQNAAKLNALVQITSPTEDWPIGRRSSPDNNGRSRFRYSEQNRSQQSNNGPDSSAKCDTFGERDSAPHDSDRSFSQRHHRNHYDRQEQLQQQQQYKQQYQQQPQWSRKSRGRSRGTFTRERDRTHSIRPIGGRGIPEPEYDAWRAERNRIDSDRISRQRTAEGHWRREWDNEKLTQEEDMREAASVSRGGGPRRTNMVQNSYGDHRAHTEDCVRTGEDSSFRSSRVPGRVRGGRGVSRGCRGNTRGSRHIDSFPNLDSREESAAAAAAAAAAAHSGRSVISIGESLKISVLNDSATSVRRVRVNAPAVAGTGRVGPRQMLRVSYSSQSEDEAPSRRVELQPNRNLSSKDKACSDSCSPSSVSTISKPPLPPSAGVKLDSEPKTQRVKRLGQDSKVKKQEKKDVNVAEISKCVHKKDKEEATVLTLACCPKEIESGGEDSWEDITTSGNDSACEELSPHSNTDSMLDITSTEVKSKMPENTGEMPQNTEMKLEMLQNIEPKAEVLQNTEAKTEKLLNKEMKSEMLQNSDFKSETLQNTEVKTEKLLNEEIKSEMFQNAEPNSEVLQNTEAKTEKLLNTEMKSEMLKNTEPKSEELQNTDVKPEVLHNTEVKVGILQNKEMKPEMLHIPEVKPDVLQHTGVNSEVPQNTEVSSEVPQNTEVSSEVLPTVRSIPNNDLDDSTEVTQIVLSKNVPDTVMEDTEKRCVSDGSTEYAELKDVSEICLEKSHSDSLVETKAETVKEAAELTEIENVSLITEFKKERLESEIKIEREERCGQNEERGKVDVIEILGSVTASSVHEEKQGPV